MAIIKKFAPFQNLTNFETLITDTAPNSDYFRITQLNETLTGGKNGFLIEGSEFLKETTEIKIEILDVEGNPIFFEPGDGIPEYYEGNSKLISIHVYDDTPIGVGKITILGELKEYVEPNGSIVSVPPEWDGVYNVKWERSLQINKNLSNETVVRFYKRPLVTITELIKPIFSKSIPTVTDTGYVHGVSEIPADGTDIRTWRTNTLYKLIRTSGSWDRDVDENTITISSPSHTAKIIEVLSDREVLVDVPYTSNNIVSDFISGSYSVTYSDFQNETIGESTLTGSFAKIDITQLKTFVGDVARVKVFRKSRNAVGDFQFVQESKLESSELLRDVTTTSNTEIPYGRFDESNLSTYWVSSSNDHPLSIDSSTLSQAVKFDYNNSVGGVQQLITSQSFSISKDVEYTLNFRTLLSGSLNDSNKSIRAFFSSSNFTQNFTTISGSAVYRTRQNISQNILSENTGDAKLVFEVKGDDWYISNVSLKNAQDTSFSPDEFTLIQDIPRKLASETFDFRFEFYDINNNYIPVDVTSVGVFDGGNDFPTSGKLLTFESDRNAFRFSSGSIANPYNQTIQFSLTRNNLTGSATFESSAFDVDGNYLNPSNYSQYPGLLTNVTTAGGLLTLSNFTGSYSGAGVAPYVGSIVYTASLENLQEFETVYRLEDGDNAPQLIVTSNANQFTYEPTELDPKPAGQSITVRAQRKNLASLVTPLTVNSGSNKPPLTYVGTQGGIDTYSISANTFSSSFSSNDFDEVTYSFTGSDIFGNTQSDEITLSKVVNFDGVSITLTNDSTTFRANGQGVILDDVSSGDGVVEVRIANKEIQHSNGLTSPNRFDIVSATATNVTEAYSSYLTNEYGISAMSQDSGSLSLNITYLAGDNSTSQSFQKKVNYTKNRIAPPSITFDTTNKNQNNSAESTGVQVGDFDDSTITIREFYTGSITSFNSSDISLEITSGTDDKDGNDLVTRSGLTLSFGRLPSNVSSTQVGLTATVTDSEGVSREVTDSISLSNTLASPPNVEVQVFPTSQTIASNSVGSGSATPSNLTLVVSEGGTTRTISSIGTITTTGGLTVNTPSSPFTTISFTSDASDMTSDTGTITIPVTTTNSEGTSITKSVSSTVTRTREGETPVLLTLTPQAQTITADSQGNGTQSPQTISVSARQGSVDVFDSMTVSYGGGISGTVSSNSLTFTDTASDMTSDTETITFAVTYTNSEGSTSTENINATISRTRTASPVIVASLNPQVQTVDSNSDFSTVTDPSTITLIVNEGGSSNYGYDSSGDIAKNKFRVTDVDGGTFNSSTGVITPTTPTGATGTSGTVTYSYTNSEGTTFTGKTIDFSVGVAVQGEDGARGPKGNQGDAGISGVSGLSFDISPAGQSITRTQTPVSYGTPSAFTVNVFQGPTQLTYDDTSPYANGSFYIDNVSGGTNNDNKTITPNTPNSLTSVTTTFDINYTDVSGSTGTVSKSHITNVVIDGNTGPGIVHTGEWESGRNYQFSDNGGGTGRRDSVLYNGTYYAATAQHTSTNNTNSSTGKPGSGPWESLGTQDLFVAAKIAIFEDSFIQNTLNVGENNSGGLHAANITLAGGSTNPYISLGQGTGTTVDQSYDAEGIFLGVSSGTPKLSLKSSTNSLLWDGTDLTVNGGGTFSGNLSAAGGSFEGSLSVGTGDDILKVGTDGDLHIGHANFASAPFSVTNAGVVTATSGTIGGWTLGASSLTGTNATIANSGNITLGSSNNVVRLSASDGTYRMWVGHGTAASAPFRVTKAGAVTATNITATGGRVGPLVMDDNIIYIGTGTFGNADTTFFAGSDDAEEVFSLGDKLTWDGTTLNISGNVVITGGSTATAISDAATAASNASTAAGNAQTTANTANSKADKINDTTSSLENPTTFTPTSAANTSEGLHLGNNRLGFSDGSNWKTYMDNNGNFYLGGTSGALTWTAGTSTLNVNRITATSGTIGAYTIDSDSLRKGTKVGSGEFAAAGDITYGNGFISAHGFYIDSAGNFVQKKGSKVSDGTNEVALDDVFDIKDDASAIKRLVLKDSVKISDGTNTPRPFNDVFAVDTTGLFFKSGTRFNDGLATKTFSSRFSSIDSEFDTIETNFDAVDSGFQTYTSCVLPGTKIITKRGEVNVEDTHENDIIKVYNFFSETWEWSPIEEILKRKTKGWSHVKTKLGYELKCSNSHWLYHPDYPGHKIETDELGVGGELYVYHKGVIRPDIIESIDTFDEEVLVYNYELERIHNYISDGILSHNNAKIAYAVTLGHRYIKNISTNISKGDLVKLDSNNELVKSTTSKDSSVVGILWEKVEPSRFSLVSGSNIEPSESDISASLIDSFGNYIPTNETGSKEIWRVASIGDSVDVDSTGSLSLSGFKICNQGGDVNSGDLLCSSDTPGYLMKQPSEWVITGFNGDSTPIYEERQSQCSYTVAKCMVSSSWDSNGRMENVYGYLYCG